MTLVIDLSFVDRDEHRWGQVHGSAEFQTYKVWYIRELVAIYTQLYWYAVQFWMERNWSEERLL